MGNTRPFSRRVINLGLRRGDFTPSERAEELFLSRTGDRARFSSLDSDLVYDQGKRMQTANDYLLLMECLEMTVQYRTNSIRWILRLHRRRYLAIWHEK